MKRLLFPIIAVFVLMLFVWLFYPLEKAVTHDNSWPEIQMNEMFYEAKTFDAAVSKKQNLDIAGDIKAIVVPHHLLASEYIAGLMAESANEGIKHVIIIGPNHENIGQTVIVSALAKWKTVFGYVESNEKLVLQLLADYEEISNPDAFSIEHSVGAMAPFVKYYLPDADIVPIIINSYAGHKDALKLADWLDKNITQDTLIIVSMDFSHYLNKTQAEKNDEYTADLINNRDTKTIATLNNDYMDSPVSLATILFLAEKRNWKTDIIFHGNSFDFSLVKPAETTSYFGIVFIK
jgi:hypothetical protein